MKSIDMMVLMPSIGFDAVGLKVIFLIYVISVAGAYFLFYVKGGKFMLPGDLYIVRAPRRIYIPFGTSLLFSFIIYIILISNLLFIILTVVAIYIAYRYVIKGGF